MTRYLIPTGLVSLAIAIFAAVGLLTPSSLGWTGTPPAWVNIALVVLLGLPVVWLLAFRHHLKSLRALSEASPLDMYAHVEVEDDSESTDYYVCLRAAPAKPVLHRVPVQRPRGSIEELRTPQAAKVFIDRRSGKPMVVELSGRRLWTMPS
jgi:hypothetical protein